MSSFCRNNSLVIRNLLHQDRDVVVELHRVYKKRQIWEQTWKISYRQFRRVLVLNFGYVVAFKSSFWNIKRIMISIFLQQVINFLPHKCCAGKKSEKNWVLYATNWLSTLVRACVFIEIKVHKLCSYKLWKIMKIESLCPTSYENYGKFS